MRTNTRKFGLALATLTLVALLVAVFGAVSVWAATINVPTDYTTIQEAINAASVGDTINVAPGTYNENVVIDKSLTLIGAGAGTTIVDGGGIGRVFLIGASDSSVSVTISGMKIRNGSAEDLEGGVYSGGGIRNEATLTLDDCTVTANTATIYGGGIINVGTMTVDRCTISGNTATGIAGSMGGVGGAIMNASTATLTMTNCTVSANTASAGAFGGDGGGIQNGLYGPGGVLTMTNCTVSGNTAGSTGGGIGSNWTSGTPGGMTLTNLTITDNQVTGGNRQGGGIFIYGGTHTLRNTIVGGNTASVGPPNIMQSWCTWTASCCITSGDPLLGPLQDNGGPTETHALLPSSPAIDAGDDSVCPSTDQRGIPRPQGAHCDIGAYEVPYAVYVDDDWTGPENCGGHVWNADAFATIQDGVDAVVGSTVYVAAGTYEEHITIDKSNLNLIGEDKETTVIDATQDSSWSYPKPGILINSASGVTVSGFTIRDATIDENGDAFETSYGPGPQAKTAILIYATSSDHVIENNILINNYWGVFVCAEGSQTTECRNNRVANNIIRDGAQDAVYLYTDGVVPVEDTEIVNNEIYNRYGPYASGVEFWVWPETAPYNLAITGTVIRGNNIADCTYGFRIRDNVSDITGTLANFNNFVGSTKYGVYNGVASTIDATKNYWGSPTGPCRQLPNGKWVGKGDKVSGNVDYIPRLPHRFEFFTTANAKPLAVPGELKVVPYPNPIRDVHTATFQARGTLAAEVEEIRVQIYDLSGHLVWEDAAPGYELNWHTDSLSGEYLANGIYLYRVQVRIGGNWINQDIGKIAVLR